MSAGKSAVRSRIGRVSIFQHHGGWYTYYRNDGSAVRQRVGAHRSEAECAASLINARLLAVEAGLRLADLTRQHLGLLQISASNNAALTPVGAAGIAPRPTISLADLRRRFLDHHEHVLKSSTATVARYGSATQHLANFWTGDASGICADDFVRYLRAAEISPNGHAHTARRKLRDKGVHFILECCRSMYRYGLRAGLLPRDLCNPFTDLGLGHFKVRDSKPIFVFTAEQEVAFLNAADGWSFFIHFVLAKTGLRPGELAHLLIEDLDLKAGWLHVRGKPELCWSVKTNRERRVPLVAEVAAVLQAVIGDRTAGPVFLWARFVSARSDAVSGDRASLGRLAQRRCEHTRVERGRPLTRREEQSVLGTIWRDAGAVPVDRIRTSFMRVARTAGLQATCPKSWRHTFATLMQEANVDLLVRQETLGHKPAAPDMSVLGVTGVYTHTTPEFQRREIERAVQLRPRSIELCRAFLLRQNNPAVGHRP